MGLSQRTLIAVASDHGESLGEHGETTHGVFLYDATLRVPLILVPPGGPRSRRVASPVSLADVAPTLADAADVPFVNADGTSLWPLVRGGGEDRAIYAESVYPAALLGWSPLRCVRSARSKFVEAPRPELYDLGVDPGEHRNVFSADRDEGRALARRLAAIRASHPAASVSAPAAEGVARLASLGYLTPSGRPPDLDRIDAARTNPKDAIDVWDRIERAVIARQSGRPEEGAVLLEPLVASEVSSAAVLRELALCLRRGGRAAAAIAVYERIEAAGESTADDLFALGVCWHQRGRDDLAARAHERAVGADPADLDAWIDLGQELLALDRFDRAGRAFEAALRLDPASVDALDGVAAVAFQRRDYAAAAEALRRALALAPDRRNTLENLARVERAMGHADEARRIDAHRTSLRKSETQRRTT